MSYLGDHQCIYDVAVRCKLTFTIVYLNAPFSTSTLIIDVIIFDWTTFASSLLAFLPNFRAFNQGHTHTLHNTYTLIWKFSSFIRFHINSIPIPPSRRPFHNHIHSPLCLCFWLLLLCCLSLACSLFSLSVCVSTASNRKVEEISNLFSNNYLVWEFLEKQTKYQVVCVYSHCLTNSCFCVIKSLNIVS